MLLPERRDVFIECFARLFQRGSSGELSEQLSRCGVDHDDGWRPENNIGGFRTHATDDLSRVFGNETEGKGTGRSAGDLLGIDRPENELLALDAPERGGVDVFFRELAAMDAPRCACQLNNDWKAFPFGLFENLVEPGTTRTFGGR